MAAPARPPPTAPMSAALPFFFPTAAPTAAPPSAPIRAPFSVLFIERVPSALPVLVHPPARIAVQTMEATAFFILNLRWTADETKANVKGVFAVVLLAGARATIKRPPKRYKFAPSGIPGGVASV